MSNTKEEVIKESPKKDSVANVKARSAQSEAGKVRLNQTKEFEIVKVGKHLKKGQKVKLNAPTEELFRELGLIK